jgi:tRNA dimethylallyltransferase
MHARLREVDPAAAERIEPGNARRTVRALEVLEITGRPFSSFARSWDRYPPGAMRAAGLDVPREVLHRRIDARTREMLPGLLTETRRLLDAGYAPFISGRQVLGYAEAARCLEGLASEEEALRAIVRRTKALARRQMAWFRRDPRIRWFPVGEEGAAAVIDDVIRHLAARPVSVEA